MKQRLDLDVILGMLHAFKGKGVAPLDTEDCLNILLGSKKAIVIIKSLEEKDFPEVISEISNKELKDVNFQKMIVNFGGFNDGISLETLSSYVNLVENIFPGTKIVFSDGNCEDVHTGKIATIIVSEG